MYFYFYDKFTQDQKYESVLTKIETRLIDLGINGRVEKLTLFKNARESIKDAIKTGAHTVVAVGDDQTFSKVLNIIAPYDVTFGFIPLSDNSRFAAALGIPAAEGACDVLSKRLCETVDLGKCEDSFFLGSVLVSEPSRLKLKCDDKYTIQTTAETSQVRIMNWGDLLEENPPKLSKVQDGKIDVLVSPGTKNSRLRRKTEEPLESIFPVSRIKVSSDGDSVQLIADQALQFNTPCTIEIVPNTLKLIVGRDRLLKDS